MRPPFRTLGINNTTFLPYRSDATITPTGAFDELAQIQTHHTMEGREIVKETTLSDYRADASSGNIRPYVVTSGGKKTPWRC